MGLTFIQFNNLCLYTGVLRILKLNVTIKTFGLNLLSIYSSLKFGDYLYDHYVELLLGIFTSLNSFSRVLSCLKHISLSPHFA